MTLQTSPLSDAGVADGSASLAIWRAHLADGRFMLQRCTACQRHVFYPRVLCPHCASDDLQWIEAVGTGTVYSTTVVARRVEQGGNHNVAMIDLDEGVRLMSRVDGVPPDEVRIGWRVRHDIVLHNGEPLLVFKPHD